MTRSAANARHISKLTKDGAQICRLVTQRIIRSSWIQNQSDRIVKELSIGAHFTPIRPKLFKLFAFCFKSSAGSGWRMKVKDEKCKWVHFKVLESAHGHPCLLISSLRGLHTWHTWRSTNFCCRRSSFTRFVKKMNKKTIQNLQVEAIDSMKMHFKKWM